MKKQRELLYYDHPCLRKKCAEVKEITPEIEEIIADLIRVCSKHNGAGLSAPQIGEPIRIFISCVDSKDGEGFMVPPRAFINPKVEIIGDEEETTLEGCISIPKIYESITRPYRVRVTAMGADEKMFTEESLGYRARNILHENDHLNGVLVIDRTAPHRKKMLKHQLKKIAKKYN